MPTIDRATGVDKSTHEETLSFGEIAAFDEEMAFLSNIQKHFFNLHSQVPIEQDDPDVRQLTEAMAAFMAKGRLAGRQQIDQLHQRVFQQLLPYLTSPVVSMALLQADTRYLTEASAIKVGSTFTLCSEDDDQAQYRSVHAMPLPPISIERTGYKNEGRAGGEIVIRIKAHNRVPGRLEHLPLFLTVNNNFNLSLLLKETLQKKLSNITAVFDESTSVEGNFFLGDCRNGTGPYDSNISLQTDGFHPVEKIRRFFQLPQQENYLNVYFDSAPAQWKNCDLILKVQGQWPPQLKLSSDLFQLGIIVVENVVQDQAEPITYNATSSYCPIRPPSTALDLSMLKCLGVYQGPIKDRKALRPGILAGGSGAYDLQFQGGFAQSALRPHLDIYLPDAFKAPVKITVDALWHHPDFSKHLWKKLKARTFQLDIPGLTWKVFNTPIAAIPLSDNNAQHLLDLGLLKNKRALTLDEVIFLLECLGPVFDREFKIIKPLLRNLHVQPGDQSDIGLQPQQPFYQRVDYLLSLDNVASHLLPLVTVFCSKLEALLNSLLADVDIKVGVYNNKPEHGNSAADVEAQSDVSAFCARPIYETGDEVEHGKDYYLIPQQPERLFFIGNSDANTLLPARNESHE